MSAGRFRAVTCAVLALIAPAVGGADKREPKGPFRALKYRLIGPAAGGRVTRVAGVPGDPLTLLGRHGRGRRLEVGQRRHRLEADLRRAAGVVDRLDRRGAVRSRTWSTSAPARPTSAATSAEGNGIYRSTDAGKTWKHVWKEEGQIGTLVVHPTRSRRRLRRACWAARSAPAPSAASTARRRRQELEAGARRGRGHRRLRRRVRPDEPAHPVRRHLAGTRARRGA